MLAIQPYRNGNLACGEVVFATYLKWKKKSHELMFENSWGREFLYPDTPIAETALKKYYDMNLVWKDITYEGLTKDSMLMRISKPLALAIDLEDADWIDSAYTRTFPIHCIMAIGKKNKEDFISLDPTFSEVTVEYTARNRQARYTVLDNMECRDQDKEFIIGELRITVQQRNESALFQKIDQYSSSLIADLKENEIGISYASLLANPNLYRLNRIYRDLLNYADMLRYISRTTKQDVMEFVPAVCERAKNWESIRNAVTKYFCIGNQRILLEIEREIKKEAVEEKKLCEKMTRHLSNIL
ncbi:MAG: hypothetical protein ACERKN_19270 [Velocimicrobium sp.]